MADRDEVSASQNEDVIVLKPAGEESGEADEIIDLQSLEESEADDEIQPEPTAPKSKKKLFIIAGAAALFIIIIAIVLIMLLRSDDKAQSSQDLAGQIGQSYKTQEFKAGKIDDMIRKANELYERGNKFEALKIYENVATYNQALSNYNLGVSQLKQERYTEALSSFKKAIDDGENIAVSAINAAVCALELKNEMEFNYYIELANSFLKNEKSSPLYSYYYALIRYYKGEYLAALEALKNPSSKDYKSQYAYLAAKIYASLGNMRLAAEYLDEAKALKPYLTQAQVYASLGDFKKAREHIAQAQKEGIKPDEVSKSEILIDLKTSQYGDAAAKLKQLFSASPAAAADIYPIKARLNPELFDINLAQQSFKNDIFYTKKGRYETLFYFAPYKVFNAKQSMEYIRKGGVNLFLDDTAEAGNYLEAGRALSKVNMQLSSAIANALNYDLRAANAKFKELISLYPEHAILRYNLALSYAQMGDFKEAARNFIASYHLAPRDYIAGALGVLASELSGGANAKFINEITENMQNDPNLKSTNLYEALINLTTTNQAALMRWLDESKPQSALNLAFDVIIAKLISNQSIMKAEARKLRELLPDDIMANIVEFIANHEGEEIKTYAKNIQIAFNNAKLRQDSFYHGASIVREQYIKLLQIAGLLDKERERVKAELDKAPENVSYMQTLAYVDIFTGNFDEAYHLYNTVIDKFKIDDASTLFLASVAATGAGKDANAIALLELSKLANSGASEPRAALGYLYQSQKNIEAAIIQYNKIGNDAEKNEFYDFEISYDKN
ncbi:tetratricopeptide repeat protein [Campylobacter sp. 19-13652]|uniref:tetratricopeptide repeat protein n=1 Tax=Campylobacter sp. 19-13652 TaxID=2840180 RepID=UPI001C772DEE|nr:tetratricopeptide repeat protein [Campylobacter sp. 19-13652]BCX79912.1 membrane protein [Campylobacter sp. 19-13652]